ncbi:hypothetical protein HBO02_21845 [Pseudomonas proteolytica]|uniref:hypothetical protein n=1 Tax=Pseudomonas proteolytica TaxID=219574 RepID=UPI001474684A|nr:hypothetical protein [Pseudomonas proteolytica]NMZ25065.1 hypothetical protein [Pseudomonas proteolytica]
MPEIKERPILFSAPMVRAILEGRKTVTRRVMKSQPDADATITVESYNVAVTNRHGYQEAGPEIFGAWWRATESGCKCPYGKPGDRLWVRETWYCDHFEVMRGPYLKPDDLDIRKAIQDGTLAYGADGLAPYEQEQPTWKPSIHMPHWASRILLEITGVRVERLQDISGDQAEAEGVDAAMCQQFLETSPSRYLCKEAVIHGFAGLWNSIGGNWDASPWVWVVEFKRVTP